MELTFSSSDETAATVDEKGLVTAKASGTALITADVTYGGITMKKALPIAVR